MHSMTHFYFPAFHFHAGHGAAAKAGSPGGRARAEKAPALEENGRNLVVVVVDLRILISMISMSGRRRRENGEK